MSTDSIKIVLNIQPRLSGSVAMEVFCIQRIGVLFLRYPKKSAKSVKTGVLRDVSRVRRPEKFRFAKKSTSPALTVRKGKGTCLTACRAAEP